MKLPTDLESSKIQKSTDSQAFSQGFIFFFNSRRVTTKPLDPTGVACCSKPNVDCKAAGTTEMPDWDVSLVTSMSELFKNKASFNADRFFFT